MFETLRLLGEGFAGALTPAHLAWAFAGVTLGTAVGVLPGIGPALTVALLLPVTFSLDPVSAFIMFGGIYYGAMYGGSTTSILINSPGETASIVTAIDGHMLARKGRASAALATSAVGSFVAGSLATVALTFFAPVLAGVALEFGPSEYFALAIVAFTTVAVLIGDSLPRGLFSLFLGLALGLVGIDQLTGAARFSFGIPQLLDGIDVMILVIGLFAVGETLHQAWRHGRDSEQVVALHEFTGMSREDWRRSWKPWLRGTAIGFPLGVLPCGGSVIPTVVSYMLERRLSPHPEEFGQGAIEGVAGPEAANNASAAGVLVPLLTLGLPSSATAAVLLTAFQQYGLQPGPLLFATRPDLVWTLIASCWCRARSSSAASWCWRPLAPTASIGRSSTSACSTPSAPSGGGCACWTCRSCRRSWVSSSVRWPNSSSAARSPSARATTRSSSRVPSPRHCWYRRPPS
jgi:putative tricarboxylic transport membrane protein